MSNAEPVEPRFPLRIIYDDGQLEIVDSVDALLERVDSIDSTLERAHLWVRDDFGRTVTLRMVGGELQLFEVEP